MSENQNDAGTQVQLLDDDLIPADHHATSEPLKVLGLGEAAASAEAESDDQPAVDVKS